MTKDLPEMTYVINKTFSNIATTINFQTTLFVKGLEYFNELTDKAFYAYTTQAADAINTISDYAKENITESSGKVSKLFGDRK